MDTISTPLVGWFPFKIPQAPSAEDAGDYSLFLTPDAVPNTNPSKFLRWKKGLPDGENLGEMLYWDPEAGEEEEGAWVTTEAPQELGQFLYWDPSAKTWIFIDAPPQDEQESFLYWDGSTYAFVEAKEFEICENGMPKTYKIPAVEVL